MQRFFQRFRCTNITYCALNFLIKVVGKSFFWYVFVGKSFLEITSRKNIFLKNIWSQKYFGRGICSKRTFCYFVIFFSSPSFSSGRVVYVVFSGFLYSIFDSNLFSNLSSDFSKKKSTCTVCVYRLRNSCCTILHENQKKNNSCVLINIVYFAVNNPPLVNN